MPVWQGPESMNRTGMVLLEVGTVSQGMSYAPQALEAGAFLRPSRRPCGRCLETWLSKHAQTSHLCSKEAVYSPGTTGRSRTAGADLRLGCQRFGPWL